jgi:hypothetical protein
MMDSPCWKAAGRHSVTATKLGRKILAVVYNIASMIYNTMFAWICCGIASPLQDCDRAFLRSWDFLDTLMASASTSTIACTGPVHWGFVVLELATSLTYDTTYVETYHWYIFVRACY